jgi:SAM-dependent methyltransferase
MSGSLFHSLVGDRTPPLLTIAAVKSQRIVHTAYMQETFIQGSERSVSPGLFNSSALHDAVAPVYEDGYRETTYQRIYDLLAWQRAISCLPPRPSTIIDAGCGTGRWASWLIDAGHRVVGIEQAPSMIAEVQKRHLGDRFRLLAENMETVDLGGEKADAVFAMGSLQFTVDPASQLAKFASWVRPGGCVALYVDSLVARVLELLRTGKTEEAMLRLQTRRDVRQMLGKSADVHLFDEKILRSYFERAGLQAIQSYGLLASASAYGNEGCDERLREDEYTFIQSESALSSSPLFINLGKHVFMMGRRPLD